MKSADAPSVTPWLDDAPAPAPALQGERRVDVAVIGAGFTGLGAALALRREGASVAVIERETSGHGASGRNAGHLTPTIGKDPTTLLRTYGAERTRAYAGFAEAAVRYVEGLIRELAIECDYHPGGNVLAAVHASQHRRLERVAETGETLGLHTRFLSPGDMRKRGLPPAFTAGVLEEVGGVLHPGRLLAGLRRAALDAGAELYERTPLVEFEEGTPLVLRTPDGRIRADRALVATNAWSEERGLLPRRVLRVLVSLFRSEPLSAADRDALGWKGREGIYTAHEMLESYRWTADGRILGGARYVRYGGGERELREGDRATFPRLAALYRERFPQVAAPIERCWSGPIALTLDFLPSLGRGGRADNLFHAVGYNGHGVAQATFAGRVLADWLAGRDTPGLALVERRGWRLPPEALRAPVFHAIVALLSALDRRMDRRVRRQRAAEGDGGKGA